MAKIKYTKTELKAQTDALKRFERFLPMLQLKKQQLQAEIAAINNRLETLHRNESNARDALAAWAPLFGSADGVASLVTFNNVITEPGNIAGVLIPLYKETNLTKAELDLFETPPWFDDAQEAVAAILSLRAEATVLEEQRNLVTRELRTTSQRVNLFEKVKIPACLENIRVIRIHLGDEQTAAVSRGKIAKGRGKDDNNEEWRL
ncbi:MAG: V-type ATP synthase subunit D [Lentisphaerae bacterium]|nr:V-type ATP synthase subunit D [Lentisphaerota bacterium]